MFISKSGFINTQIYRSRIFVVRCLLQHDWSQKRFYSLLPPSFHLRIITTLSSSHIHCPHQIIKRLTWAGCAESVTSGCCRRVPASCYLLGVLLNKCSFSNITPHVLEAFSSAYPDKEVPRKTVAMHQLATKFRDSANVCLWQVLIEPQSGWSYGCADFKQCFSYGNVIRLREFNISVGFVTLFVKGFSCSSCGCVLNGISCTLSAKLDTLSLTDFAEGAF